MNTLLPWVLLVNLYAGNTAEVKPPAFFHTQAECESTLAEYTYRVTSKNVRVKGMCLPTNDPTVRAYLIEELTIRQRTRR